jgi:hypothetical protein
VVYGILKDPDIQSKEEREREREEYVNYHRINYIMQMLTTECQSTDVRINTFHGKQPFPKALMMGLFVVLISSIRSMFVILVF